MKFQEFGEIVQEEKPKFQEFGEIVKEGEKTSRTRSLLSAPVKGAIKGAHELAELRDPIAALFGLNSMTPHQKQVIEMILPTQEKSLEKGLERAGRIGVSAIGGPETLLAKGARTALGAGLGQLAEEADLPEWAQGVGELSGFASPKFGKKLLPKKSQQQAVEFLRNQGLTDKEIVPLVRSENFMNRFLSNISAKGKKTKELVGGIKSKLGESYDVLKESGKEKFLKGTDAVAFDDKLSDVLEKINPRFSRLIEKDVEALRNKGISQKNLIDFYQDINAVVGKQEGGKAVLGTLKKPILEGLQKIDPEAAHKFTKLNEFYAKGQRFAKSIKPTMLDKLLTGSKTLQIIGAVGALKFGFLPKLIGAYGAQRLAAELTMNPRLQNLTLQMAKSLSQNQIPSAVRTFKLFEKELRKVNEKAADSLIENRSKDSDSKKD